MNPVSFSLSGDRHAGAAGLADLIDRCITGRAAERLVGTRPAADVLVVAPMPVWSWGYIPVGRKDRDPSGGRLRLPFRVTTARPLLVAGADRPHRARLHINAFGLHEDHTVHVTAGHGMRPSLHPGLDAPLDSELAAPVVHARDLDAHLRALADDGVAAQWELRLWCEHLVAADVRRVAHHLRLEASATGHGTQPGLDDEALGNLSTWLAWGTDSDPGLAVTLPERALAPDAFAKVEPTRWLNTAIYRAVNRKVRSLVGDPRSGRQIRAAAHDLGTSDPRVLADRLGPSVGVAAAQHALDLQVGQLLSPASLDDGLDHGCSPSAEDLVLADHDRRSTS